MCASTRSGFCCAPTAASSTPRTRRRSTRTSIRSISRRIAWRELCAELTSIVEFWIAQGVRIFRVDNPHTKPFAFWEWLIARGAHEPARCDFSRRGVHPPGAHVPAREARLQPVLHLFHLAQQQGGAHRVFHRACRSTASPNSSAPTSGPTRRTSSPNTCNSAAARPSWCASCWPQRSARATGSTARPSNSWSTSRASPAARSISTRRNTSCATGILSAPTACATSSRA